MKKWIIIMEGDFEYKCNPDKTVDKNVREFLDSLIYEGTDVKKEFDYKILGDDILLISARMVVEISSDIQDKNDVIVEFMESLEYNAESIRLDYSIKTKYNSCL